eukprot:SAG31_NODE_5946_length_2246_cov_1.802049_1_plen_34_part_10
MATLRLGGISVGDRGKIRLLIGHPAPPRDDDYGG